LTKRRIDSLLVERGLVESRAKAQALIMAGEVVVDGKAVAKSLNSSTPLTLIIPDCLSAASHTSSMPAREPV